MENVQVENTHAQYEWEPPKRRSPWVAFGALGTAAVLMGGLVAFKKGNQRLSQHMMRARIAAQGGTVIIMLITSGFMASKSSPEHTSVESK